MDMQNTQELAQRILDGDRRALARGISLIENGSPGGEELLSKVFKSQGNAHRIGIAGPPGVGKSTITLQLARLLRARNRTVGIVAVDPSSPFSGGALLGDRIRMTELFTDPGVFIRSMATRGSLGGIAAAATGAADLIDAAGKSVVIFETVGIGQTELDIAEASDTVVLALAPESGNGVQVMKAGFMEIADVFVVNKADREGADRVVIEIENVLSLREASPWKIPVIQTAATQGDGIEVLLNSIEEHYAYLSDTGLLEKRRTEHLLTRVRSLVKKMLIDSFWTNERQEQLERIAIKADNHRSPHSIAREIVERSREK